MNSLLKIYLNVTARSLAVFSFARGPDFLALLEKASEARGSKISEIIGAGGAIKISEIFGCAVFASGAIFRVIYFILVICAATRSV